MSREIKFRVMDIAGSWHYYTLGDFVCLTAIPAQLRPETWTQFTGLKDVNGVEIYEGDIVVSNYSKRTQVPKPVTYENDIGFTPIQEPVDYDEVYASEWQVIGNIHQNPELLP